MSAVIKTVPTPATSVVVRMATKYGVDAEKLLTTLKATCFKGDVSTEQLMALLVVSEQHSLNPWTKEIYAFPAQGGGIVPVVGVDGWSRIINENPAFDGMDFNEGPLDGKSIPEWIECVIYRKDRAHPIKVKEYFSEVFRDLGPWKTHPRRMLRHKAMIQCARLAFGFGGIYDQDEAERIIEGTAVDLGPRPAEMAQVDPVLIDKWVSTFTDIKNSDLDEDAMRNAWAEADAELNKFDVLKMAVFDALAARGIITRANYRKMLKPLDGERSHG